MSDEEIISPAQCNRLTAQLFLAHEDCVEGQKTARASFTRLLKTKGQPDVWSISVGNEWQSFPDFRVTSPGIVVIESKAGKEKRQVNPTKEEVERAEKQIVRVRYKGQKKGFILLPKGFLFFEPEAMDELELKADDLPVRITITVAPR